MSTYVNIFYKSKINKDKKLSHNRPIFTEIYIFIVAFELNFSQNITLQGNKRLFLTIWTNE